MNSVERKAHWEKIYQNKALHEVSWYQAHPVTSLEFIREFNLAKNARIIDVGGGDSLLVDHLLELGYTNLTVLDISESAIERAKIRLGEKAERIKWIVHDAAVFRPDDPYDLWHDRAAFHFLQQEDDIEAYLKNIQAGLAKDGKLVIGTFSEDGPNSCSGVPVRQYSENSMGSLLGRFFKKLKCIHTEHKTPFNTIQNFIFCSFSGLKPALRA
ncbi:MAG TPA: class I SAM-dependent methyltransferase [Bacteroidia bacterium]|nr:class I SAM-dependent methyltransferase [Bacteroidia bacterium]